MNIQDIFQTIQDQVGGNLQSAELPPGVDRNQLASFTGDSIISNLKGQAANGDFSNIMEMFSGKDTSHDHPGIANMSPDIVNQISSKFGLDSGTASSIVSQILPGIMNTFNSKVHTSGFDLQNILSQFGNQGGVNEIVQNLFNNNSDKSNPKSAGILSLIGKLFGR